jgi:sugar (glycoside-pentoside-hexuronide) transporter
LTTAFVLSTLNDAIAAPVRCDRSSVGKSAGATRWRARCPRLFLFSVSGLAVYSQQEHSMAAEAQKLGLGEKIGYSLGDLAANFVFQMQIMFLSYFYTEVFGIAAATVGTLFLITRLWHAVIDPLMGVVADRTNTRWGRFRPWVLWSAIPFGVLFFLTYTVPNFDQHGKVIWAYTTYILLMLVYTINNIPYSAMTGVLTGDSDDRTSLASWRFIAAMTAAFIVQTFTPRFVEWAGDNDKQLGYQITIGAYAMIAVVCFVITFLSTKERVQPDPNQSTSLRQDVADLAGNGPWWALFVLTLFTFINLSLRGSTTPYYFQYYIRDEKLLSWFNGLGLATTLIGVLMAKPLAARFGKRNVFIVGLFLSACFIFAFVWLPPTATAAIIGCQILYNLSYGPTIPLLWAMMADTADYSEWRTGRRATGLVFSTMMFALNSGLALGGALTGWLLAGYGYVEKLPEQSERALEGIKWMFSVYPAVAFFVGCAALLIYRIDRRMEIELDRELTERRKQFQPAEMTPPAG